ncbi:WRKY domain containing protein [Trema orientale]|uniref:WRKY domain containing protein n=1 Tax=Trema orientale TaxID=63057 RepID=A0A2P5DTC4_TREOI|nr:WRKY domain containing protein [Trema orientale]
MEKKNMDFEQKTLINELTQGKELAKQLISHLQPSSSKETRDVLVGKILSSYEKALSMLNWVGEPKALESPPSMTSFENTSSPRSVFYDQDSNHRDVFKKRKTMSKWTEKISVSLGTGPEGPMEDGYSWRKYGQKDILGANHPRGYFRCTHRKAQGCLATKQVQRSDQDPSLLEVTYKGRHTCSRASQLAMASASLIKQGFKAEKNQFPHHEEGKEEKPKQSQSTFFGLGAGFEVKTEDLDTREDDIFQPFSFSSTPIESENLGNHFFSEMIDTNFAGSFSPSFISPTSSESAYFSVSPCHNISSFGLANNVKTPESDLNEILSAPTSVSNSPIGDLDLTLDKVDFESNFPFDSPEFFT